MPLICVPKLTKTGSGITIFFISILENEVQEITYALHFKSFANLGS